MVSQSCLCMIERFIFEILFLFNLHIIYICCKYTTIFQYKKKHIKIIFQKEDKYIVKIKKIFPVVFTICQLKGIKYQQQ